jgi:hypothetical protein
MKIFQLQWREVLDLLPAWEALSPDARRGFLAVKPSQGIPVAQAGATLRELEAAGLVTATAKRAVAVPRVHTLLIALRAMHRLPLLEHGDEVLLSAYLQEHFTDDELRHVTGQATPGYLWVDRRRIALLVRSVEWVKGFLALKDARAVKRWEAARLVPGEAPRLAERERAESLRALIEALARHPRGVPLRELPGLLPGLDEDARAAVLDAGIRYLLVFPAIPSAGDEALLGLLPGVAARLGPPPPPPTPVEADEIFDAPYLVGDMTAVLVEAATAPIPLRGTDGEMYVRARKALAPRLQPMPEWATDALLFADGGNRFDDPADRAEADADAQLAEAARTLLAFGLARTGTDEDGKYQLVPTAKGAVWLARDEGERLRELIDVFRNSSERNPGSWRGVVTGREFFPSRLSFELAKDVVELRTALADAFLALPAGAVVRLRDFVGHHALAANPFLAHDPKKLLEGRTFSSMYPATREAWEELWADVLQSFLALRLLPFGGARLGRVAGEPICFGVTEVGRYLLGATDTFDFAPPAAGEVIVQPDFEILFMAPAPRLEPELSRIADRIGSGVGALFRITRASVIRAAQQGISADDAVKLLEGVSRTPVPANVARQIRDWIGGTRRVSVQTALLIECPDAETAGRVLALTAGHGQMITPTLIRLPTHALERKALVKKLRDKGIFVST